ncbi:hypothetical protein P8Q88_00255 [Qipengyuania sp. XHP0207]|uniref:hypothetical protein n=1 Tax=Qipengyuania sp. XHP0207 TaxID=3038078 RepID=UPI00241EF26C|nr:hypothetical protein [Qipengyuania sp. XHP0207]MDG5746601.1 hypothetical protein [Qipengyuania sp. XHP0207]
METKRLMEASLQAAEDRIDWVLAHPGMSDWLKQSLRSARERDPVEVLNDLELLQNLLGPRSKIHIQREIGKPGAQ